MSGFLCVANKVRLVFGVTKFVAYSSAIGYAVARNMGLPATAAEVALLDKIRAQLCDCHKRKSEERLDAGEGNKLVSPEAECNEAKYA